MGEGEAGIGLDLDGMLRIGQTSGEVSAMSKINPAVRTQFESLSIDLKNAILERDVSINNLSDLISVLQQLIDEAETA